MKNLFEYVVLRFAPDFMRGEVLNVGYVLFAHDRSPEVVVNAPLPKLRALDFDWNQAKLNKWRDHVAQLISEPRSTEEHIHTLAGLGYCVPGEPGMFYANNAAEVRKEVAEIRALYIHPRGQELSARPERRTRLSTEMRKRFENMQRLGKSVDDLANHLMVQNVPVPSHPDLRSDFVFKNGVYRITQTVDYRVSAAGAHQKVNEVCTKSMAADLASKAWGEDTVRLAVVNVPEEVADIADSHLDLLLARNFKIFHADNEKDLLEYHRIAFGEESRDFELQVQ